MRRGDYTVCWILAALVALAPLPFGSVGALWSPILQVCVSLAAATWVGMRWRRGLTPLPWTDPVLLAGAALLACGLLQLIPLPLDLVRVLSPHAAGIKETFSPEAPSLTPMSLVPYATWRSCVRIVCWTLAALMVRHCAVDLKGRLIVAGGLVGGGLFQAGYGLFEFISGRQHIFGYQKTHFTDVATGTFISRNNFAGYLEMAIPLALALALLCLGGRHAQQERLGRLLSRTTGRESFRALLLLLAAFLMTTALLMSRSRMGIIGLTVALAAAIVALGLEGRTRRFAFAAVAVLGLAAVFATQIDILPLAQRFVALRSEFGSGYGRLKVWTDAMPMLSAYPLFGSGLGTWEVAFSPFRRDTAAVKVDFAHNDYLEFLAEAGLLGALVVAVGALMALRQRARWRASGGPADELAMAAGVGLVAMALHSFTDFHLSIPADALAAAMLAGLFLRPPGPVLTPRAAGTHSGRRLVPALLCAVALLGLTLSAASPAMAEMRTPAATEPDEGRENTARHVPRLPEGPGGAAPCPSCLLDPRNPAPWFQAAARARRALLADIEAIVRLQNEGDELPPAATRAYLAGQVDRALGLVNEGLRRSPASARGHMEAGLLLLGRVALTGLPPEASEDYAAAQAAFERAMRLQPWRAATHRRIARAMGPYWEQAGTAQRAFIQNVVRRARQTSPGERDLGQLAERMGM